MKVPTRGGGCVHCGHDHFHRECLTCRDTDGPCRAVMVWELKQAAAKPAPEPTPPPEAPKRGWDAADLAAHAEASGRAKEREDVINWLTEAQFHVVTQDEVSVILKIREQIRAERHVPKVRP